MVGEDDYEKQIALMNDDNVFQMTFTTPSIGKKI